MPIQGSLRAVAAASRLALGPLQAEVADLLRSLAAVQRTLDAMPANDGDSFRQVHTPQIGLSFTLSCCACSYRVPQLEFYCFLETRRHSLTWIAAIMTRLHGCAAIQAAISVAKTPCSCWHCFEANKCMQCQDGSVLGNKRLLNMQVMIAFHKRAEKKVASLEADLAAAVAAFGQLAAYVNGTAKASVSDPQAFFTVLITFARDLDIAHSEVTTAEQKVLDLALARLFFPMWLVSLPAKTGKVHLQKEYIILSPGTKYPSRALPCVCTFCCVECFVSVKVVCYWCSS